MTKLDSMKRSIAVGLTEPRAVVRIRLEGSFHDRSGQTYAAGEYEFDGPTVLRAVDSAQCRFELPDFTIGIGFHWERRRRAVFQGDLRVVRTRDGLIVINDVPLETYVASVIASEMSASSPVELLRAHAVISRSWLVSQIIRDDGGGTSRSVEETGPGEWRIKAWYGREGHEHFDVCADDHCQRYQGVPGESSERSARLAADTAGRFLTFDQDVCDARFSKCCGGMTEAYSAAWEDRHVPYLTPVFDGEGPAPRIDESWLTDPGASAFCNTKNARLLAQVLPGFDQETQDFFRWRVEATPNELTERVYAKTGIDPGPILEIIPLRRGPSGRITELRIRGAKGTVNVGKELEIRRVLSDTHLYSSAFVVGKSGEKFVLMGAGWGHGVGLCQIGAAVLADRGWSHARILAHYYPGTSLEVR